jgi:hypothetical protein
LQIADCRLQIAVMKLHLQNTQSLWRAE